MDSRFRGNDVRLDGKPVAAIHADLTAGGGLDLTQAKPLKENANIAFRGTTKNGTFELKGELARQWLKQPNPNNKPNSTVLRPWLNGQDVTNRNTDFWIIDFGVTMPETEASLFELPYQHVLENVKTERQKNNREAYRLNWWIYGESRPGLRLAIQNKSRFIATLLTSKHRLFVWLPTSVIPDQALIAITSDDDTTFGILHSRFHELWSLRMGSWMGVGNDPRYTPTTCFETFPFPEGLTPNSPSATLSPSQSSSPSPQPLSQKARDFNSLPPAGEGLGMREAMVTKEAISESTATAAIHLNQLRENWLNPTEWVDWVITPEEEKANYPMRAIAKMGFEVELKKRTLTNLYNQRPTWLDNAHKALDKAVANAYGWADYTPEMSDDEILRRLLKLNLERSEPS
jgi:type II restriction/modification system DNA methylase subunit YeeA